LRKELGLKSFLICCFVGTHSSGYSPNILLRKEVARGGGGRDTSGRLSGNIIKGSGMGEHGLGVEVRWGSLVFRKEGTPEGFW